MLHSVLEEKDAWCYWVVSVGALLSFLGLVAACICSCRRNQNKTTSANRSLPDIPKDKSREHEAIIDSVSQDIYETTQTIGDHSELYATVQDAAQEQMFERETQEIILQECSSLQDTSCQYTRFASSVSESVEHPYAQLQNVQKTEASQVNRNNQVNQVTNNEKPSTSMDQSNGNPIAPPRTRRSSSHNSLFNSETHYDIQAANAISGGVQANQDLPYMTPPLLLLPHPQHNSPQQHFSGDSQDSKGYTSISVREPLANIIAQTKATYRQNQPTRPITDSHYATVSDDSDEMYAAIDEQDKVYTSGSETYAQIQPMTLETQRQTQHEQIAFSQLPRIEEPHSVPQPPSVDSLRHVAHAHSRQASSSSATSSIINLGSPKPEKRQANSPLPPPPEAITEGYAFIDKKCKSDDRSKSSLSTGKSLEDMYAKVMKKKKEIEQQNDAYPNSSNVLHSETNTSRKLSLIEISRASWCSHESVEIQKKESDIVHFTTKDSTTSNFHSESNNSTSIRLSKMDADMISSCSEFDHKYEAVNLGNNQRNSIVKIVANLSNPNYKTSRPQCSRENNYQSNSMSVKNNADIYSTPFKHRQVSNSSDDPGYEKVLRRDELDQDTDSEPNYESMPHDANEPNYASVCRPGDSDTDPNYECVNHADPNYESVKYMSFAQNEEPPYEQVNNFLLDVNADGYEKVKSKKKTDADYEKIKLRNSVERISSGGDTDDEQYVQV
ncbi:uncharacterized protein LOC105833006 isoform X1 [Monomorium pharaonis]|uniref:uncharacterized protein LOC105833006 isoform X1 n=1 Tax=Monomorium pharaonis TaxID=307658 RepID=UPI00063F222A|nr:uncharacterized protein LOC105833006 isoform X1 [Monomorium pharaonis]XP_012529847.1 uncharacterized protein LOC105833006 isoform X1 [Monomorium pharaonis]